MPALVCFGMLMDSFLAELAFWLGQGSCWPWKGATGDKQALLLAVQGSSLDCGLPTVSACASMSLEIQGEVLEGGLESLSSRSEVHHLPIPPPAPLRVM